MMLADILSFFSPSPVFADEKNVRGYRIDVIDFYLGLSLDQYKIEPACHGFTCRQGLLGKTKAPVFDSAYQL